MSTVNLPDDCVVMPRASVRELVDAHLDCRKKLQQALARIQALDSEWESRLEKARGAYDRLRLAYEDQQTEVVIAAGERDECREQLQQALARIQALESRLAEQPKPPFNLSAPYYIPPGWVDPDLDLDAE